jgi:hypothetical protein
MHADERRIDMTKFNDIIFVEEGFTPLAEVATDLKPSVQAPPQQQPQQQQPGQPLGGTFGAGGFGGSTLGGGMSMFNAAAPAASQFGGGFAASGFGKRR